MSSDPSPLDGERLQECTLGALPEWGTQRVRELLGTILSADADFPCTFAVSAVKKSGLRFGFVDDLADPATWEPLVGTLSAYLDIYQTLSRETSLIVFFRVGDSSAEVAEYYDKFWSVVQFLHERDPQRWPAEVPTDPDDYRWEFSFGGTSMFLVCGTPAHVLRRSRRSSCFVVTFQPRWVFEGLEATSTRGAAARRVIRGRLARYDAVAPAPELGGYGDPSNREWRQYFLADTNAGRRTPCPFHPKQPTWPGVELIGTAARKSRTLPTEFRDRVRAAASAAGVTPSAFLQAVLTTLWHRYSASPLITIGCRWLDRDQPGGGKQPGHDASAMALSGELSGEVTFTEILRCRRAEGRAAEGYPGRHPAIDPREAGEQGAQLDLVLDAVADGDGATMTLTYRTDLFTAPKIRRMLGHLHTVAVAVAEDGNRRIADLPLLTAAEHAALRGWSTSGPAVPPGRSLAELFGEQAARHPDCPALAGDGAELTHRELDERASQWVHALRSRGVGPRTRVGLYLHRSPRMVVALLAVIKAGGVFLLLDRSWPTARIEHVVRSAGVELVVTEQPEEPVPLARQAGPPLGVLTLDALAEEAARHPPSGPPAQARVHPDDVAYLIYTSGSTGEPKGVMIRSEAICARLLWQAEVLGLGTDDAVLAKAPASFDISVNEILLPLVCGARLVLAPPGTERGVRELLEIVERYHVTFLYIVASMLDVLLESGDAAERGRSLRHVWCGGEALTPALYTRFRAVLDARMYHGYGPAETTIGVTCLILDSAEHAEAISIGRPNPGTEIYVVDAYGQLVPVGVPGEIWVGGSPVGLGYVNQPGLTAERFIANPFGTPGARLYRTGDIGYRREDGEIAFIGRRDDQVKIRGVRIELGEIEKILQEHPAVRHAVAVVRGEHNARSLAVCVVPADGQEVAGDQLRDWLRHRLPELMVPHSMIVLAGLPLTPAGKVDKSALLQVAEQQQTRRAPYVRPGDELEHAIARAWQEALEIERVGAQDNFFDLGGHSLLLLAVQSLLEDRIDQRIRLVDFYTYPTVRALARHLSAEEAADDGLDRARQRAARQRAARTRRGSAPAAHSPPDVPPDGARDAGES